MENKIFAEDPINRVDGRAKVTGAAKYFAEFDMPNMSHCIMVTSEISKGTITSIETKNAENAPGVLAVFTHLNMPKIPGWEANTAPASSAGGQKLKMLGSNEILFNGQSIALVIADTLERAQYASTLVKAKYNKEESETSLEKNASKAVAPKRGGDYKRGDENAYKNAAFTLQENYTMPAEVHSPMELHGIAVNWSNDDKVMVYTKTQGVKSTQRTIASAFKIDEKNIQVSAEFVGGGFGMALRTWPQDILVVAAAKALKRPVKLMMTREQMFTLVGYRPATLQTIALGATADGKLTGMYHEAIGETSTYDDFTEGTVNMTKFMYACPNVVTKYRIVPLNRGNPIWMRGPGEATGAFALESAMDEMAYKLNLDPIEFRIRNYAETDPQNGKPFSAKNLKEGYQLGAEKIGWYKRNPKPASMKDGEWLVGYGMSSGTFGAFRSAASVKAILQKDGSLILQSSVTDIGTGTGSVMAQIAHEVLGIPTNKIKIELGDSMLPPAPTQGGSSTTSSVGTAVHGVCNSLKTILIKLLVEKNAAFKDAKPEEVFFNADGIALSKNSTTNIAIANVLKENNLPSIEATEDSKGAGAEQAKYSIYSFSIHFTEVRVHPKTGVVRVKRAVTIADAGKIVSPKTAASQMIGGVTGGIGMALTEEVVIDHRTGRLANKNFGDYHVPVHADVPHIDTIFIDKPDYILNPVGSKGMGEIALIGFAAAVANAVFHATGKRIRELPITPDKLI